MSDYVEQISVDNASLIEELSAKINNLEAQIKQLKFAPIREMSTKEETQEEVVVQKRNDDFHYIETKMIEDVLNNGNVKKKKILQTKLDSLKTFKKERVIINTLNDASVVACSDTKAIITLPLNSLCDFMMRKENKNKVLIMINDNETLIEDYYAIPQNIWDVILKDYTTKYKNGNKKPTLDEVNIDVRLYDEVNDKNESEMQKLAFEIFGDLVNFE
jgi:hypothetical protein